MADIAMEFYKRLNIGSEGSIVPIDHRPEMLAAFQDVVHTGQGGSSRGHRKQTSHLLKSKSGGE